MVWSSSDGLAFPSEKIATPISLDKLWRRSMRPRREMNGMASFQVRRKPKVSLSKKAGVDPKVDSDQTGHGIGVSLGTPVRTWSRNEPHSKALEAAVGRKPRRRPEPLTFGEVGFNGYAEQRGIGW